jgi:hypothetical protein
MFHSAQAHANLVSGTVTLGSITAGGTSDQYFSGTSGQGVYLTIEAGYSAYITVYEPGGTLWTSGLNRFAGNLPATGTFHVVIKGYYSTDSGPYSLYYNIGGGGVSGGTLTSGGSVNATQPVNGLTSYQFTGTTGEGAYINANGSSFASATAYVCVYNPDGTIISACAYNRFAFNMAQTGTYTVVILGYSPSDSGSYNLYYVRGGPGNGVSGGTVTSGLAASGTLPVNGLASFYVAGVTGAGYQINLKNSFASATAYICVYNPDGTQVLTGNACTNNRFVSTMTQTGNYTVVIEAYSPTDTGSYILVPLSHMLQSISSMAEK